jgi:hypothetical protein
MDEGNKPLTKRCPFCAEEVLADAVKCRYCGEWLSRPATGPVVYLPVAARYAYGQRVWHFIFLTIATLGIYEIRWFYRNWKYLKAHLKLSISPGWRTVGLFLPIVNIVLMYSQFRDIRDYARDAGCDRSFSPGGVTVAYIVLALLFLLPYPYGLLCYLTVWPLAVVQDTLNVYWRKEQPDLIERRKFTGGQIFLLIIGGIFWFLFLLAELLPDFDRLKYAVCATIGG